VKLTHVRLLADDFSTTFRFYRDGLGLGTPWDDNGDYAEFDIGSDVRLAIFSRVEMGGDIELRGGGDGVLLVLDVGNVDTAYASLRAHGVEFVDEPHDRSEWGLRVVHLRDPDANLIELFHDIEWDRL